MKKKSFLSNLSQLRRFFKHKKPDFELTIPKSEQEKLSEFVKEEVILRDEFKNAKNVTTKKEFEKKRDNIILEEEIYIIQKSTRTTFPQFLKLHNKLRAAYRWYYKWHLFPFVNKFHWGTLGVATTILALAIINSALSFPNRALATNASVAGTATVVNTNANLTFDSGTYLSNVTIDNTSGQMAGYAWSDDMGWVDFANTGSSPADPVVVDVNGNLSGKAKVINGGYIDFDSSPTGANVAIAIGGNFSGYAWSDDLGWINFTGVTASNYNPMPADPSAVSIGSIDSTLFTVSWTDNSSNETGFKVFVSTTPNADCSLATYPGSPNYTTAANAVSQAVTGKSVNTQYCAKVVATNAEGDSSPAYSSPAYTLANQPNAPTVSGNYSSGNGYFEDVVINTNNNPGSTNFWIQYSTDNSTYLNPDGMAWQTNTSYTLPNLSANTQYWFKVKAKNGANTETAYSAASADVTPPSAPTGLSSSNVCQASASTSWTASNGADRYSLSYGSDIDATNLGTINNITTTNQNLSALSDNTPYYFKVSATSNANGTGPYSGVATFTTGTCTAPTAPSDFAGSAVSTTQINWTWSDTAADETGWHVQDISHNNLQNLPANSTSWNETSLSVNTGYTRHTNVYNANGNNDSNQATIYTLANVPLAPTVVADSSTAIQIIINQNSNPDANTRYAIYNQTLSKYVKHADGTFQNDPDWQLYADWGGASGFLNTGLTAYTPYIYKVKAENGDNIATAFSVEASAITLTTPPSTPAVTSPTNNSSTTSPTDNKQNTPANPANGTTNSTTEPTTSSEPATTICTSTDSAEALRTKAKASIITMGEYKSLVTTNTAGKKILCVFAIQVKDDNGDPLVNKTVLLHSTPVGAVTDEDGVAVFNEVEVGEHKLSYVTDKNKEVEVAVNVDVPTDKGQTIKLAPVEVRINEKPGIFNWLILILLCLILAALAYLIFAKKQVVNIYRHWKNILRKKSKPSDGSGDGYPNSEIKDRSQFFNPENETWYKRDTQTGQIMDGKADGEKFKGVKKER